MEAVTVKGGINLLPAEAPPRRRIPWRRVLAATATVVLVAAAVVAAGAGAWLLYTERVAARERVAALQEEAARLQAQAEAARSLPAARARLEERQRFVREQRDEREVWRLLEALARASPSGLVVSRLTLEADDRAVVEGTAPGLSALAAFMRGLEASGRWRRPQVLFPDPFTEVDGLPVIPFRLSVTAARGG